MRLAITLLLIAVQQSPAPSPAPDPDLLEGWSRVATAFTLTPGDSRALTLRLFTSP